MLEKSMETEPVIGRIDQELKQQLAMSCAILACCLLLLMPAAGYTTDGAAQEIGEPALELMAQLGGATRAVTVRGDFAYAAIGPRLAILDISDATQPHLVGQTPPFASLIVDVGLHENVAYLAGWDSGLILVDITDPRHPLELATNNDVEIARDVTVDGNIVYVVDSRNGLHLFSISNPLEPVHVGTYAVEGSSIAFAISDNTGYLAANSSLHLIDLANPAEPKSITVYELPQPARGLAVDGNVLYATGGQGGLLTLIDVSDHTSPKALATASIVGFAASVTVKENLAYVGVLHGFGSLHLFDVSNSNEPVKVGSIRIAGGAADLHLVENELFVAGEWSGIHVIDVDVSEQPREIGFYDMPWVPGEIAMSRDAAFITTSTDGLRILDISNVHSPVERGSYTLPGPSTDIAVSGNTAYVTTLQQGLHILDISDPFVPREVSSFETPGSARRVVLAEDLAYIADEEGGLRIIDVRSPDAPQEIGNYQGQHPISAVAVNDGIAYVGFREGGLRLIDVSQPASPYELSAYEHLQWINHITVSNDITYVASLLPSGLWTFDTANPEEPIPLGAYHRSATSTSPTQWPEVIAGAFHDGFHLIDISSPRSPQPIAQFPLPGTSMSVSTVGDTFYVTNSDSGLYVLRYAEDVPTTPTVVPFVATEEHRGALNNETPSATPQFVEETEVPSRAETSVAETRNSPLLVTIPQSANTNGPRSSIWLWLLGAFLLGGLLVAGVFVWQGRRIGPSGGSRVGQNLSCPNCGAENPPTGKFCVKCGKPRG